MKATGFQGLTTFWSTRSDAKQRHVHAGGTVHNVLNRDWHVAGIVEPGKLAHLFVQMPVLQELLGSPGHVSQIFLKLDDPKNTDETVDALKAKYEGYGIWSVADMQTLLSVDNIPLLQQFHPRNYRDRRGHRLRRRVAVHVYGGAAAHARDRHSEIAWSDEGVRDGADPRGGVLLGLGGTIVGILLSFASRAIMQAVAPASLPQAIVYGWWPIAGGIAHGRRAAGRAVSRHAGRSAGPD